VGVVYSSLFCLINRILTRPHLPYPHFQFDSGFFKVPSRATPSCCSNSCSWSYWPLPYACDEGLVSERDSRGCWILCTPPPQASSSRFHPVHRPWLPFWTSKPRVCLHTRLFSLTKSISPCAVSSPFLFYLHMFLFPFTCHFTVLSYYCSTKAMYLDLSVVPRMFIIVLFLFLVCAQSCSVSRSPLHLHFLTLAFHLHLTEASNKKIFYYYYDNLPKIWWQTLLVKNREAKNGQKAM
jgi:hypothetical protein